MRYGDVDTDRLFTKQYSSILKELLKRAAIAPATIKVEAKNKIKKNHKDNVEEAVEAVEVLG